jgi:twitching motility protein PilT
VDREKLVKLLTQAIQRGASDLHLAVGHTPHFRVKGDLLQAKTGPLSPEDTVAAARLLLDNPVWDPSKLTRERDFSHSLPGIGRFRVHLFRQRGSVGVVIRVIPYESRNFEALHLPEVLSEIATAQKGLILVAAPNGMGKSTTIAALIQQINASRSAHVVTMEDPIEFLFGHGKCIITQREVGSDTLSYRDALIASLRQDPDVIMVGEVREQETAEICLRAAETGNLVISAVRTTDVKQTLERWLGWFPVDEQQRIRVRLADCLSAIVAIRLLVNQTGMGLVPAVELLRGTRSIREYLRRGERFHELSRAMEQGRELYGMQTFDQHIAELYCRGEIKLEVAQSAATSAEELERFVAAAGKPSVEPEQGA